MRGAAVVTIDDTVVAERVFRGAASECVGVGHFDGAVIALHGSGRVGGHGKIEEELCVVGRHGFGMGVDPLRSRSWGVRTEHPQQGP